MCIKHYTIVGHVGVSVCMSVSLLCCGLSYASTWWTINFWNCGSNIDDDIVTHYSLLLDSGLCSDSSAMEKTDFENCASWQQVHDDATSDTQREDAELYIHAKYTCISTLVLSSILFCISIYD